MEKILKGVFVGAAIGGALGLTAKYTDQTKEKIKDLGHQWDYVKADQNMTQTIYNLKAFRHADEACYYSIGENCNYMVSMWFMVTDTSLEVKPHWVYKAFQYRQNVERALLKLSDKIEQAKRDLLIEKRRRIKKAHDLWNGKGFYPEEECEKSTNMKEFAKNADALVEIVQNYYYNIVNQLQQRQ
jgi:hypothetical protein